MSENTAQDIQDEIQAKQDKASVASLPTTLEAETKRSGLTGPVSAIICSVILSASFLAGSGKFDEPEKPNHQFATVHYDGGFKAIGYILEQTTFSTIEIYHKDKREYRGTLKGAADFLNDLLTDENRDQYALNTDVKITGSYGLEWTGSLGNFKLTTGYVEMQNTDDKRTLTKDMVRNLNNTDRNLKQNHMREAKEALTFSREPKA